MGHQGLLIGEVAARSGVSRKALRLYEAAGILAPASRTPAGYRVFDGEVFSLLAFVARARRLGLSLAEIKDIVAVRRSGQPPCPHVRALLQQRLADVHSRLADLSTLRARLRAALTSWRTTRAAGAAVCPHIEREEDTRWSRRSSVSARRAVPARRSRY